MLIEDNFGDWWNADHIIKYYIDDYNHVCFTTADRIGCLFEAKTKEDARQWLEDFCVICNIQELSKHDQDKHNAHKSKT